LPNACFHHKKVWETKSILSVLEDNSVDLRTIKAWLRPFQNDPFFDALFFALFCSPVQSYLTVFLNESNLYTGEWLRFEDFLLPADREEGFKSIRFFWKKIAAYLKISAKKITIVSAQK
jgi:hypothetical protein